MTSVLTQFYNYLNIKRNKSATNSGRVSGPLKFSGGQVEALEVQLEAGLLAFDGKATYDSLEQLFYLLELQIDSFSADELTSKMLIWRASVLRSVVARTEHAARRVPNFMSVFIEKQDMPPTFLQRILTTITMFSDYTLFLMSKTELTPNSWFMTPPDLTATRKHLGVACFHVTRVMQRLETEDQQANMARNQLLEKNFDLLFYAMTHGAMISNDADAHLAAMLQRQFQRAEEFFNQDQPPVSQEPEKYMIPKEQVVHSLTTMARVRETLERLSV